MPIEGWHSPAPQAEDRTGLGAFGNAKALALGVQGRDFQVSSEGSLGERNRNRAVEIVPLPLEKRMLMNLQHHVKIARGPSVRSRLPFATDAKPRAVIHAGWNLQTQDFLLADPSFPMAVRASFPDHLSHTLALRACLAESKESLRMPDLSAASTSRTRHRLAALLGSRAMTGRAAFGARNLDFRLHAEDGFLEGDLKIITKIRATLGTRATSRSPPEEIAEKVAEYILEISEYCRIRLEA